jgi:leucyl aminopeptidase
VIALGDITTGLMGNDEQWIARVLQASELAGEKTWQLPLFREYRAQLYSDMADIRNVGGRPAGAITGGMFLKEFVGDTPWVHLDIAGTAWNSKWVTPRAREATGAGVRTMANLVWELAS